MNAMPQVYDIFGDIIAERKRQDRLRDEGKFKYTAADPGIPPGTALAALTEEVGEVATEVLAVLGDDPSNPPGEAAKKLRKELIQVAAVAVAWCEKLDREKFFDVATAALPVHGFARETNQA